MSSQLYAAKKPCNNCGGLISWDKTLRERLGTNLPLNLDRTIHDRNSCNLVKTKHPGLPRTEVLPEREQVHNQQQPTLDIPNDRRNAIQIAHDQNMVASEALRQSIDSLTAEIKSFRHLLKRAIPGDKDKDKETE